jgi:TolA-binding protein
VPPATNGTAAATTATTPGVPAAEQPPVAGEIVARAPAERVTKEQGSGKRNTDLGIGPDRVVLAPAGPPATASGEVVGAPAKAEEARPVRKIILDPEIPEDGEGKASSRGLKVMLGIGGALALAGGLVWFGLKKTERPRRVETAEAQHAKIPEAAPPKPVEAAGKDAGIATPVAVRTGPAFEAARKLLDERAGDPKVARALPTEFPQLLAACRTAFTEKRAKDAEVACVAAKDAGPESAEANALLGHALFSRKKRKEALLWAERAVELDPKQADAYVIIGSVKQAADDTAAAKAAYKKYLELAPTGQYATDLRAILETL